MIWSAQAHAACCTRSIRWQQLQNMAASWVAAYWAEKLASEPDKVFRMYFSTTATVMPSMILLTSPLRMLGAGGGGGAGGRAPAAARGRAAGDAAGGGM